MASVFTLYFLTCVYQCVCVEVRNQLVGVGSLLPRGPQESNLSPGRGAVSSAHCHLDSPAFLFSKQTLQGSGLSRTESP